MKSLILLTNLLCLELYAGAYTRPLKHTEDILKDYYFAGIGVVMILIGASLFSKTGREIFKANWGWYVFSIVIVSSGTSLLMSFRG